MKKETGGDTVRSDNGQTHFAERCLVKIALDQALILNFYNMITTWPRLRHAVIALSVGWISQFGFAAAFLLCSSAKADIIYVANQGNSSVTAFDESGAIITTLIDGINHPLGLAVDQSGNLFVGNYNDLTITRITPQGSASLFANALAQVQGLAFDQNGNLYAANPDSNNILKFSPSGTRSVFASLGLNHPGALAFDLSGNLYVSNGGNSTIMKFDQSGTPTLFANSGVYFPRGLAFDSQGNLYVANGDNTINKFDPNGVGTLFASAGLNSPVGLAFDANDNLFVSNFDNSTLMKFDQTGSPSFFANTGVNLPFMIAISPIPEPGSCVLFATALVLGLARFRWTCAPAHAVTE